MNYARMVSLLFLAGIACSSATSNPAAPWQGTPVVDVPAVYLTEWERAENRDRCVLVAFGGVRSDATPRRANFAGGWAVAYDLPGTRSAFGIAGSGAHASDPSYQWPDTKTWSDGSTATWGLEGGTGPNHLAYVRIAGQDCLYNVWSALGKEHLEELIARMRFVR